MKLILSVFVLSILFTPLAHAEYGYHYNKKGTGYFRDDSNDGNSYNNANSIGLNDRGGNGRSGVKQRTLGDY